MRFLSATGALVTKDLRLAFGNPLFLVLSLVVPTVFVGMFALVIHTSATNPVGVARYDDSTEAAALVEILSAVGSVDGPYYRVRRDPAGPRPLAYEQREVPGVIRVPADFAEDLTAGGTAEVPVRVFNIDSDVTKNLHLRLEHSIRVFNRRDRSSEMVAVEESVVLPKEMPMSRYFGTALLMFSVVFLAMFNTGILVTEEWERGTVKAVVLSPEGLWPFMVGKWISAFLLTALGTLLVALVLWWILDYPVSDLSLRNVMYLLLFAFYGSAIGALLGVRLQSSLMIVPASAVISIAHLLLCGFESYIRGVAHSGVLGGLWWAGSVWPISSMTDEIRMNVEGMEVLSSTSALVGMVLLSTLLVAVAMRLLRTKLSFAQGM